MPLSIAALGRRRAPCRGASITWPGRLSSDLDDEFVLAEAMNAERAAVARVMRADLIGFSCWVWPRTSWPRAPCLWMRDLALAATGPVSHRATWDEGDHRGSLDLSSGTTPAHLPASIVGGTARVIRRWAGPTDGHRPEHLDSPRHRRTSDRPPADDPGDECSLAEAVEAGKPGLVIDA